MENLHTKNRNKEVRSSAKKLMKQGVIVKEVYISLFTGVCVITFKYKGKLYDITDNQIGENIEQTLNNVIIQIKKI